MKLPISAAGGPIKASEPAGDEKIRNPYFNSEFLTVGQTVDLISSLSTQLMLHFGMRIVPPEGLFSNGEPERGKG